MLSKYPKNLVTVTGIGKDYFVVRAETSRSTYSNAFGTRTIERVIRFDAVTEFLSYVNEGGRVAYTNGNCDVTQGQ